MFVCKISTATSDSKPNVDLWEWPSYWRF